MIDLATSNFATDQVQNLQALAIAHQVVVGLEQKTARAPGIRDACRPPSFVNPTQILICNLRLVWYSRHSGRLCTNRELSGFVGSASPDPNLPWPSTDSTASFVDLLDSSTLERAAGRDD